MLRDRARVRLRIAGDRCGRRHGALPADSVFRRAGDDRSLDHGALYAVDVGRGRVYRLDLPRRSPGWGFCWAVTTLSRPVFMLFPFALAGIGLIVLPALRVRPRPASADGAYDRRLRRHDAAVVHLQLT